mgnify:CR=1 FL=1
MSLSHSLDQPYSNAHIGNGGRGFVELGDPGEAILLPQGGFYQTTGGNWVYVIDETGNAVKRNIRLGRKNDQHFEVLEGLQTGDRVITSSYDTFGDADRLILQ